MEKRIRISSNIRFKKYLLPWILILFTYLITKYGNIGHFWVNFAWFIIITYSLVLFSLKKVEYTKSHVYFNNKQYDYKSIKSFKTFEVNQNLYYFFTTDSKNIFSKYHIIQLRGISLFSIIKTLFKKSNLSDEPFVEFLDLLDKKTNFK
jgi:hypothetical protein